MLLSLITILDFLLILAAHRLGSRYLLAMLVANIILVSVFASKLISVFGYVSNVGNIFYASTFLCSSLLVEHSSAKETKHTIYAGVLAIFAYLLLSQITIHLPSLLGNESISQQFAFLFSSSVSITIGSVLAFVAAQLFLIHVYDILKGRRNDKGFLQIAFRAIVTAAIAQWIDSIIFFPIAFHTFSPKTILEIASVGYVLKVCLAVLSVPIIYLSTLYEPQTT